MVDVAGGVGVEDIFGGLQAGAGAFPELGFGIFGTAVEVEVVFAGVVELLCGGGRLGM